MSLYTLAEASLTTAADRRRRPSVNKGQICRTLVLCLILFAAFVIRMHRG